MVKFKMRVIILIKHTMIKPKTKKIIKLRKRV